MWQEINFDKDIEKFMVEMQFFHDGCIKELKYTSGAFVDSDLCMNPINNVRVLKVIIQQQQEDNQVIELEFAGLKFLNLYPFDENYTCEIIDSTMLFKDGYIYWCDQKSLPDSVSDNFEGTFICSSKVRWRRIENNMGSEEYYCSINDRQLKKSEDERL